MPFLLAGDDNRMINFRAARSCSRPAFFHRSSNTAKINGDNRDLRWRSQQGYSNNENVVFPTVIGNNCIYNPKSVFFHRLLRSFHCLLLRIVFKFLFNYVFAAI